MFSFLRKSDVTVSNSTILSVPGNSDVTGVTVLIMDTKGNSSGQQITHPDQNVLRSRNKFGHGTVPFGHVRVIKQKLNLYVSWVPLESTVSWFPNLQKECRVFHLSFVCFPSLTNTNIESVSRTCSPPIITHRFLSG